VTVIGMRVIVVVIVMLVIVAMRDAVEVAVRVTVFGFRSRSDRPGGVVALGSHAFEPRTQFVEHGASDTLVVRL
jgi:hypothetical protein